jgi:hypothetical protein
MGWDAQNGHPTRQQARKNRRRTLWGTLRIFEAENEVEDRFQHPVIRRIEAPVLFSSSTAAAVAKRTPVKMDS